MLSTNVLIPLFSKYAGTNVSLEDIVKAASDLQLACRDEGYPSTSIAIASEQITNGIVTMNVYQGFIPQIVVNGRRYAGLSPGLEIATYPASNPPPSLVLAQKSDTAPPVAGTNAIPSLIKQPAVPASSAALAQARTALLAEMAKLPDTRIHVVSTNTGPRFEVQKYLVMGNSLLSPTILAGVLTNIDGAYGTNVSFDGIRTAVVELQGAYSERGYVTVSVKLPQQRITNSTVKVQVTEGRLAVIAVTGNRYFSSNNVMRALPDLHTNMVLNGPIFQSELNRANGNQDRQIYPVIGPGPDPGTSALTLKVKDQLPLHGKVELNNESSPGTPDLRVNSSAVYNNLWQLDHSLGVQYSFSPQQFKPDRQWGFFDEPAVANYSTFYRLPLGSPSLIEDAIASDPVNFGYDEATRKFNVPTPSGQPDLTVFASRSTIDTGLTTLSSKNLYSTNGNSLDETTVHNDVTINSDIGLRMNIPLAASSAFSVGLGGGIDFKSYKLTSYETNIFSLVTAEIDYNTKPPSTNYVTSQNFSPVPTTVKEMNYLPLSLMFSGSSRDAAGTTTFGLGGGVNVWYDSQTSFTSSTTNHTIYGSKSLQVITGSRESTGYWFVFNPSLARTLVFHTNWVATFRADGQWASEPLISNEQFGIGGVNSVRGYHEGEDFGDTGWHLSLEQQTPPYVVGSVYGRTPLTVRGSVYMDYAHAYLLDPHGRPNSMELWGTGFGVTASVGSHWQARFLFSDPLIGTSTTPQNQLYFNFALTAQF